MPPAPASASGSPRRASSRSPSPTATRPPARSNGSRSAATRTCRWRKRARSPTTRARRLPRGGTPLAAKVRAAPRRNKQTRPTPTSSSSTMTAKLDHAAHGHATRTTLQRIGRVYGWNDRPIASITDDDAAAMLADIAVRAARRRRPIRPSISCTAMFKWAKQPGRKFVTVNPFADLPAPGGPKVDARPLPVSRRDPAGLARARRATVQRVTRRRDRAAPDPGDRSAARAWWPGMVGSELRDLRGPSEHGPHWSLPAERMKAGSAFITPLSPLALELLRPHLKTTRQRGCSPSPRRSSARSGAAPRRQARDEALDAARSAADRRDDPRSARATRSNRSARCSRIRARASRPSMPGGTSSTCGARWRRWSSGRCARRWPTSQKWPFRLPRRTSRFD